MDHLLTWRQEREYVWPTLRTLSTGLLLLALLRYLWS